MNDHARQSKVLTAAIMGVEAKPVTVEVSFTNGLPGINVVGMPDMAVNEARARVRSALRACGYEVPNLNILVNLAPSDIPKTGSGFDLPIALGILLATGQIELEDIEDRLCIGELSLDGSVRPVRGMLAYEQLALELSAGMLSAVVERGAFGKGKSASSSKRSSPSHVCIETLACLREGTLQEPLVRAQAQRRHDKDFADIAGNELAKRALTIAAAGEHGLLMIGPPGSGKTMMASRLPTIMAPLEQSQRYESAMIYSVAGLPYESIMNGEKPFRAPHHTATRAGLMGGCSPIIPGEVSLAHNGILFLDEMPEFGAATLQLLRQPMENGTVSLARARGTTVLPASFMLVAASNPCPCGFLGDPERSCSCSDAEIRRYQGRIGGPLLDRIDLVLDVWRSKPGEVLATGSGLSSAMMREQVVKAKSFAIQRALEAQNCPEDHAQQEVEQELLSSMSEGDSTMQETRSLFDSAVLDEEQARYLSAGARLIEACKLEKKERFCLEEAAGRLKLSGRGIMRALAVARTIADIEQSQKVRSEHIHEALNYRADGRCGNGAQ